MGQHHNKGRPCGMAGEFGGTSLNVEVLSQALKLGAKVLKEIFGHMSLDQHLQVIFGNCDLDVFTAELLRL